VKMRAGQTDPIMVSISVVKFERRAIMS